MGKPLIIINVLDQDSYNDCHIKGSINVPLDKLAEYAQKNLEENDQIIIYCASFSCTASDQAWHLLQEHGFENVVVYSGGAAQWFQLQFPMEGACQNAYLGRQENPQDRGVPTISAQELKKKMEHDSIL